MPPHHNNGSLPIGQWASEVTSLCSHDGEAAYQPNCLKNFTSFILIQAFVVCVPTCPAKSFNCPFIVDFKGYTVVYI